MPRAGRSLYLSMFTLHRNGSQNHLERLSRKTRVEATLEPNKVALFRQILQAGPYPHQLPLLWQPGLEPPRETRGGPPGFGTGHGE